MGLSGLTISVVGGGIGGMAAATALAQRGATVTLYEQATAFAEVGAGLQISANGQRILRALGVVTQEPPDAATVSQGTVMRDGAAGRLVARIPSPQAGPTWYLHRADLLGLLRKSALAAGVLLVLDRRVMPDDVGGDLIVAADGAKSEWRTHVDGDVTSQFTGQVAWRAVVPWNSKDGGTSAVLSMGRKAHTVIYPLRGGTLMNLVAIEERRDWTVEGWSLKGDADQLRQRFAAFGGVTGDVINAARDVHLWALHTRPVARNWTAQNIALLGDAAHPTLPFMAQGACLALEDAWVLAQALDVFPDVPEALQHYQDARRSRAERVVALAQGNAWRFHLAKPVAWGAQAVLAVGAGALARRLEWLYGYDATAEFTDVG